MALPAFLDALIQGKAAAPGDQANKFTALALRCVIYDVSICCQAVS
jgi:hypothetical protein